MYFDTSSDYSEAFADFYEKYMAAMDPDDGTGDCSAMAISPAFSKGIYALEKRLKAEGRQAAVREGADHRPVLVRADHRR